MESSMVRIAWYEPCFAFRREAYGMEKLHGETASAPPGSARILWMVDAYEENDLPVERVAKLLHAINPDGRVPVEPVYVMTPGQLSVLPRLWPNWTEDLGAEADEALRNRLKPIRVPGMREPQVLFGAGYHLRDIAHRIDEFGRERGADLIVLATHARKGVSRWFLGSFAEALILRTSLPMLTLGPTARLPDDRIKRVLFATAIDDESRPGLAPALTFCGRLSAQLHLYTKYPLVELPGSRFTPPASYRAYLEAEASEMRRRAEEWKKAAQESGVDASFELDRSPGDLASSVVSKAEETGADLILLQTSSSVKSNLLIGSTARQVIRSAECPVLVIPHRLH